MVSEKFSIGLQNKPDWKLNQVDWHILGRTEKIRIEGGTKINNKGYISLVRDKFTALSSSRGRKNDYHSCGCNSFGWKTSWPANWYHDEFGILSPWKLKRKWKTVWKIQSHKWLLLSIGRRQGRNCSIKRNL